MLNDNLSPLFRQKLVLSSRFSFKKLNGEILKFTLSLHLVVTGVWEVVEKDRGSKFPQFGSLPLKVICKFRTEDPIRQTFYLFKVNNRKINVGVKHAQS